MKIKKGICIFIATITIIMSITSVAYAEVISGKFYPWTGIGYVVGKEVSQSQTKGGQTLYGSALGGDLYDRSGTKKTGSKYVLIDASHSKGRTVKTYASMDTNDYLTGSKIAKLSGSRSESSISDGGGSYNSKAAPYTRKISVFGCAEGYWNSYSYVLYPTPINV